MPIEKAPFLHDIDHGPVDAQAWWLRTRDGVRLRTGLWFPEARATHGTVFLFPGRTEYIEKYGHIAASFAARGLATFAIDWRGQGLADRQSADPMLGDVALFADYQLDVAAMVDAAHELDLPRPWFLIGHSMGGAIALRAVLKNLEVTACAFSGPMWGINMAAALRPVAWGISSLATWLGLGSLYAPSTGPKNYVLREPFESNKLTCDRTMYERMIFQARAHPELGLGGPSLRWLNQALRECRDLARHSSPDLPCLTILGSDEAIVDPRAVHTRMQNWPDGHLMVVEEGRHEVLMDAPALRDPALQAICDLFETATATTSVPTKTRGSAVSHQPRHSAAAVPNQ